MFETFVTILGYISQVTQVIGLRITLLFGSAFFGSMAYLTFTQHLYANAVIRTIAAVICLLGFFKWHTSIYRFRWWHMLPYGMVVIIVGFLMANFTNDLTPIMDTLVASMGLIATFLLAVRSIYNWGFLLVLNCFEAIMFLMNHDYQIFVMQVIFALSSILGIIIWLYRGVDKAHTLRKSRIATV